MRNRKKWTEHELSVVRSNMPNEAIKLLRGRTYKQIYAKRRALKEKGDLIKERLTKKRVAQKGEETKLLNFVINGVPVTLERAAKNVFIGVNSIKIDF